MEQVETHASTAVRLDRGMFTFRSLYRARQKDLAASVRAANDRLRTVELRWVESREDRTMAVAARDWCRLEVHTTLRTIRLALASRSLTATREHPYRSMFPRGIAWYVDARLQHFPMRVAVLLAVIDALLAEDDPVRAEHAPLLRRQLLAWDAAVAALHRAEGTVEIADGARRRAHKAWAQTMIEAYAAALVRLGKRKAEQCFTGRKRRPAAEEEEDTREREDPPKGTEEAPAEAPAAGGRPSVVVTIALGGSGDPAPRTQSTRGDTGG
jgi:hypothetical protein